LGRKPTFSGYFVAEADFSVPSLNVHFEKEYRFLPEDVCPDRKRALQSSCYVVALDQNEALRYE
jgi:hypothetical protein